MTTATYFNSKSDTVGDINNSVVDVPAAPTPVIFRGLHLRGRFMGYNLFRPPSAFYDPPPPVTNYMLLYSTLLCKKIARAPGGVKI